MYLVTIRPSTDDSDIFSLVISKYRQILYSTNDKTDLSFKHLKEISLFFRDIGDITETRISYTKTEYLEFKKIIQEELTKRYQRLLHQIDESMKNFTEDFVDILTRYNSTFKYPLVSNDIKIPELDLSTFEPTKSKIRDFTTIRYGGIYNIRYNRNELYNLLGSNEWKNSSLMTKVFGLTVVDMEMYYRNDGINDVDEEDEENEEDIDLYNNCSFYLIWTPETLYLFAIGRFETDYLYDIRSNIFLRIVYLGAIEHTNIINYSVMADKFSDIEIITFF